MKEMTNPLFERYGGLIRIILYFVFLLWATLLFFLCIARLNYTSNFRDEPSLNGGLPFYGAFSVVLLSNATSEYSIDPCVVELLVAAITGMAFAIFMYGICFHYIISYLYADCIAYGNVRQVPR